MRLELFAGAQSLGGPHRRVHPVDYAPWPDGAGVACQRLSLSALATLCRRRRRTLGAAVPATAATARAGAGVGTRRGRRGLMAAVAGTAPVLLVPNGWWKGARSQPQLPPSPSQQGCTAVDMTPAAQCCGAATSAQVPLSAGLGSAGWASGECRPTRTCAWHCGGEEGCCSPSPGRSGSSGARGGAGDAGGPHRCCQSARSSCPSSYGIGGGRRGSRSDSEPDVWSEPTELRSASGSVCSPRRRGRRSWRRGRSNRPSKERFYARCRAFRDAAFLDEAACDASGAGEASAAAATASTTYASAAAPAAAVHRCCDGRRGPAGGREAAEEEEET